MKQKAFWLVLNKGKWGFDANGIGAVDTDVMRAFSSSGVRIIHGIEELREFLKTDEWKESK